MRGFKFNGKHIYRDLDFKIFMQSKSIQPPSKKKVKVSVPFMDGGYDFSTVGTNGEPTYEERKITVILGIPAKDKEQLYRWYSKAIEWLVDSGKGQLIFDDILDYYFIAEVESASTFEEIMEFGNLTVEFTAEPFKQNVYLAGSEEWDLFNFEDDAMQDVEFDVVGSKTITLYNTGRVVSPMINTDAVMYLVKDEVTYDLVVGDNKKYGFKLQNGTNSIEIYGTGHVKFLFRKEVL